MQLCWPRNSPSLLVSWPSSLRGEAFPNYLLGVDPLAYNAKSSRFFEHR